MTKPPTPAEQLTNAAIELCDHLPVAYRAPILAQVSITIVRSIQGRPHDALAAVAAVLDELTDALTTRARVTVAPDALTASR